MIIVKENLTEEEQDVLSWYMVTFKLKDIDNGNHNRIDSNSSSHHEGDSIN